MAPFNASPTDTHAPARRGGFARRSGTYAAARVVTLCSNRSATKGPHVSSAEAEERIRDAAAPPRGPAGLTPGYFAGVMGTGILSIGAQLTGHAVLASVLFWIAVVFYVVLVVLNVWRFAAYRRQMSDDFHDPARAFGFFTFIAATNVIGAMLVGVGLGLAAAVLLAIATLAWVVFGYVIPWTAVLGNPRRPMLDRANGTWFIWVVASQSIAVVAAGLEPLYPA